MEKIRLYTYKLKDGVRIKDAFVAETTMPPFSVAPPDVVVWGARFFTLWDPAPDGVLEYVECFVFFIVDTV